MPALTRQTRAFAAVTAAAFVVVSFALPACGKLRDEAEQAANPPVTGPPPGASQPPGPPLATAAATVPSDLDPADPATVAVDCFVRWQSYDATVDSGPDAGLDRARACMTPEFFDELDSITEGEEEQSRLWEQLRESETKSTVEVLATTPVGGVDTTETGRVSLLLNVRRVTTAVGAESETAVSTPALALLRQPDGSWLLAGADLSYAAGDAPGR